MNQAIHKNALIKLNREGNKFPKGAINFLLTRFWFYQRICTLFTCFMVCFLKFLQLQKLSIVRSLWIRRFLKCHSALRGSHLEINFVPPLESLKNWRTLKLESHKNWNTRVWDLLASLINILKKSKAEKFDKTIWNFQSRFQDSKKSSD